MTSTPDSPKKPEKHDDSDDLSEADFANELDESSDDAPVLLESDAEDVTEDLLEIEDFPEETQVSEEIPESFPPAEPAPRKSGFFPMVLGGLVAGAIGFGAAFFLNPGLFGQSEVVTRAIEGVDSNATSLAELSSTVDTLGASIPEAPDLSGLEAGLAELGGSLDKVSGQVADLTQGLADSDAKTTTRLSELTATIDTLRERVAALEVQGGNTNAAQADEAAAQLSAFQTDLDALVADAEARIVAAEEKAQAILAEAQAAAEAKEQSAAEQAALALKQAALSELKAAVDAGASFKEIVTALDDVPPELASHADTGVPTMVALQQSFAPAARAALATVQTVPEDASTGERFSAFLRRQTNARSLAPKEGNDADAVLSRAEAHLSAGKLSETLSEVSTLPEDAQAAMSGWLSDAQTRQAALKAVDALSAKLN